MFLVTKEPGYTSVLREYSTGLGFSLFGTADISDIRNSFLLPESLRDSLGFAISLGKRLVAGVLDDILDGPTPLYFHHYRQINYFLDRGAFLLASRIQDLGFRAVPIPASQVIDWPKQRAHLSHKKVGEMAGLGWIGRNNLLVSPELGSLFRLVTVLTDMPLEAGGLLKADCGTCRKCIEGCPANAIKERREDFEHIDCFRMLKEFRNKGLVSQYICGLCVKACSGRPPFAGSP
jgi:epoxyqueuosine reductase